MVGYILPRRVHLREDFMTQTILRKARSLTAAVVGALFLFTTVATPLVEANFWEQRRDASRRATGKNSDNSPLLASLPASLGKMDGVLPSVHGSLGNVFQSAPPLELSGIPTPADLRAATLPTWLRGLPSSAGEIRHVALAKNAETAPVVVLVQDVHNVFSAQKSIAQIVSHLESAAEKENRGPVLIGLEGGYRSFDLDRFRAFRDRPGHALVSELLLKTNLISGPEYFAFLAEKNPLLWGVETPADYIENVEAVRASHPAVERVTAALNAAQGAVEAKGSEVFSKELKDLNKTLAAQARGDISIVDLVRVLRERSPKVSAPEVEKLQKALALEAGIDFARVERERAALIEQLVKVLDAPAIERLVSASLHYRSGQISFSSYHNQLKALVKGRGIQWSDYGVFDQYVQYVLLAESIDKFRLFDELEDLKSRAVAAAGRTSEEKTVMGLAEDLRLLSRLVRHEFGPVEWKAYLTRRDDLKNLQAQLHKVLGSEVKGPSMEDVALFERFYRAADKRNDSLINNLLAKGKETNAKVMALVAGGFHTPELESRLKAKGYSVVTITPQIGEIPQGHAYMDIFLVKHVPIEEFLAGQKLYLSPLRMNGETMVGLTNYAQDPNAVRRTAVATYRAVGEFQGVSNTDLVAEQFPHVQTSMNTVTPGAVTVTAVTEEGSVQVTAASANEGTATPDGNSIASVEDANIRVDMRRGVGAKQSGFTVISNAIKKVVRPVVSIVMSGVVWSTRVLAGVGDLSRAFKETKSFGQILNDWILSLTRGTRLNIVPDQPDSQPKSPEVGKLGKGAMRQGGVIDPWQGWSGWAERMPATKFVLAFLNEFSVTLKSRLEIPVDDSRTISIPLRGAIFSDFSKQVTLRLGKLGQSVNLTRRNQREAVVLRNSETGEELIVRPVVQVRPAIVNGKTRPVKMLGLGIGDYVYTETEAGVFDVDGGWIGNSRLLEFLGTKEIKNASSLSSDLTVGRDGRFLYGSVLNDPPSASVGDGWVPRVPLAVTVKQAQKYFKKNLGKYRELNSKHRLQFLHSLSILTRSRVYEGHSSQEVLENRLLATTALREAASVEGKTGNYAWLVEKTMWASGLLVVKSANRGMGNPNLNQADREQFADGIPFTINQTSDFDKLAEVAKGLVAGGDWSVNFMINIKNFAPDTYLAYLEALEAQSARFNGHITFFLSVEKPGTIAHDLPGATTAMRRMADIFGDDFFTKENLALITDGGSKTRGGPPTNAQHGQFSLAPLLRITPDHRFQVTTFLETNILTTLVAWLQMQSHGRSTLLWPASDGIILFGANPGFGDKSLAALPSRFMAASGPKVQLFSPNVALRIVEFHKRTGVGLDQLFNGTAPSAIQSEFDLTFNGDLASARNIFEELKLVDKGNFIPNTTGMILTFVEKKGFNVLAEKAVTLGGGSIVMNIFFLMADKQTVLDLLVKKFHGMRGPSGIRIGQEKVSVFDRVFGGYTTKAQDNALSIATINYFEEHGVSMLGVHYGEGGYGGDIGNLDLNARGLREVVQDPALSFSERFDSEKLVIPGNVRVLYNGKPIDSLSQKEKEDARFILSNVRVSAPNSGTFTIRLVPGSAIINSHIQFNGNFKGFSLSAGSVIIDSLIAGPVTFHGPKAVVQSVSHFGLTGNSGSPQTRDVVLSTSRQAGSQWEPVAELHAYGGETIVTIFLAGEQDSFVVRAWDMDYKDPIRSVAQSAFRSNSIEHSLSRLRDNHPKIIGIPGISDQAATSKEGTPWGLSLYELRLFAGHTFEEVKGLLDSLRIRHHHNAVREPVSSQIKTTPPLGETGFGKQQRGMFALHAMLFDLISAVGKGKNFLNLDVFSGVITNKWARGLLVGLVLLVISPVAMAAPGVVMAGLSGWDVGAAFLGSASLVGLLMGAIKMVSKEKTLFEQTGRTALGEELVPKAREQLTDLKSTTRFLSLTLAKEGNEEEVATYLGRLTNGTFPLYGGASWAQVERLGQSEEVISLVLTTSRNSLVQSSDVMAGSAGNLVDALGALNPSKAREPYADHAVRAALLANLAAKKASGAELYTEARTKIMGALGAFGEVLFGQKKAGAVQTQLNQLADSSEIKPADLVPVDNIQPGVVKVNHLDETSGTAMILNVVEMLERHALIEAKDLSVPGTGIVVTVAPGMEAGENAELIRRLVAAGETASKAGLPIRVHQGILNDGFLAMTNDELVVNVVPVLGLLNINLNQGNLKVQLVASPTSTVVFNKGGLPQNVVVEKILWLLEGVGLRISSEDTEQEIRSLIAALKAA